MQEQIASPALTLHSAFVPHGDGLQGSTGGGGSTMIGFCVQRENGSPMVPGGQLQMGLWFCTSHTAKTPQVPGQGSMHFWAMQAMRAEQSVFCRHSALQPSAEMGSPWKPLLQLQTTSPDLSSLHSVLGPQGEGSQGFWVTQPLNGSPLKPGWHRQSSLPLFVIRHSAFAPHGPGSQRATIVGSLMPMGTQPWIVLTASV